MKISKLFFLFFFIFISNCRGNIQTVTETQGIFLEFPQPSTLGEKEIWTAPGMLWNGIQYLRFSLSDEEKKMHQSAVYHALNNSNNSEITSWYSKERLANGKIRVIHSFPISDGHCRVYQSLISLNGATRHFTNNACKRFYATSWLFLK
jgi:surface antigen